jgi:hypothetical protein
VTRERDFSFTPMSRLGLDRSGYIARDKAHLGHEANHSPSSGVEVKDKWRYTYKY